MAGVLKGLVQAAEAATAIGIIRHEYRQATSSGKRRRGYRQPQGGGGKRSRSGFSQGPARKRMQVVSGRKRPFPFARGRRTRPKAIRFTRKPTMPRTSRKRRGRRAALGKSRRSGVRARYARRSTKFRKYRRRARRSRTRIRIYPMGVPLTKIVKLRMMKQCQIFSQGLRWGKVAFQPNSLINPFFSQLTATDQTSTGYTGRALAHNHTNLKFVDKAGTILAAGFFPQPNGYDQLLSPYDTTQTGGATAFVAGQGLFQTYKVLETRMTLTVIPDSYSSAGTNLIGGWTRDYPRVADEGGEPFLVKHARLNDIEVSNMLNQKIIKRPQLLGSQHRKAGLGKTFTHVWKLRNYRRKVAHGQGAFNQLMGDEKWSGTYALEPEVRPQVFFIIADVASSTTVAVNFIATFDYTVKLSDRIIGDDSTFGTTA